MISEVIHKPNIGNAPAAIYEYTATVMCWGSWQTMAAWYTLTAKGVTLYHAVMVYHGSMVIDVFPYCKASTLLNALLHDCKLRKTSLCTLTEKVARRKRAESSREAHTE